jgi:2-alkenal reductase
LLLVAVLALSACTANLPDALASLTGLTSSHTATAPAAAPAQIAQAAPGTAPVIAGSDLQEALQSVYKTVNPSVVNIRVTQTASGRSPGTPRTPGLPFGQPGGPRVAQALGSGFVWDQHGHIVTNNHMVDGADQIEVTFYDGLSVSATVVGRDPDSDLAVLKVDPAKVSTLRPVTVSDSTQVKVGQFTVAIGNPFGLEGTMTFGIVSALGRTLPANNSSDLTAQNAPTYTIPDVIQTDAPVNPGNSGGVLLDLDGRLIGVPSAIESPAGTSAGIGFAIPSAIVQQVVPALIQTGRYEHPWIGISGTTLTSEMAGAMGLPATQRGTLVVVCKVVAGR